MTDARDTSSDDDFDFGGASVFNHRGQRVNEIDLNSRRLPKTIAEMTDADWRDAETALQAFDAGQR